ncbi:MAG: DUF4320 family protein [Symbiobacteriaceae bacterium]|nr:DUF4320 family protein [Symbiobacteriaceae bacterium]
MKLLHRWRSYRQGDSGDMYVDFLIKFFLAITVVATLSGFFNIFIQHQHVVFLTKRVTRALEISGQNDAAITALFNKMRDELRMVGAYYTVSDVSYIQGNKIQLRDTFTVTVRYPLYLQVVMPLGAAITIPFTLEVRLPGMSEVFWR